MKNRSLQLISTGIILILVFAAYLNNNSNGNTQEQTSVATEKIVVHSYSERHDMLRQHLTTRIR